MDAVIITTDASAKIIDALSYFNNASLDSKDAVTITKDAVYNIVNKEYHIIDAAITLMDAFNQQLK